MTTLGSIELPDDLEWPDEHTSGWKVGQTIRASLDGSLIVQEAAMKAGRKVTLQTRNEGGGTYVGVVELQVLDALKALEATAGAAPLALTLPAPGGGVRTLYVRWRRTDGPALEATPLKFIVPAFAGDLYSITLRLIEI